MFARVVQKQNTSAGCSKRPDFSPAHPLARRDVPFAQAKAFRFLIPFLEGVAEDALYCTHRTTVIHLIDPSKLARSLSRDGGWLIFYCARPTRAF